MPKRSYPFGDEDGSLIPQMKVHIGERQVDNTNQDKMKAVYDKTLSLLYRGAKNLLNNNTEHMDTSSAVLKDDKTNLHQMVLTAHGTLTKPSQLVKGTNLSSGAGSNTCVSCKALGVFVQPSCSYCECKLCNICTKTCHFCKGDFCAKCSLTVYLQEERVVCLSCC